VVLRPRLAPVAGAALALAGCGGSPGRPGADPASAVPPSAWAYAEVEVKPPGARGREARAGLRRLLGGPGGQARLERAFTRRAAGATFDGDVLPWLGRRVGAFVAANGGLVLVVPTPDPDTARGNLEDAVLAGGGRRVGSGGASLSVRGHRAVAVVRGIALAGNRPGVRAAVRTLRTGRSLAAGAAYRQATVPLPGARVATGWVAPGRAPDVAGRFGHASLAGVGLGALGLDARRPAVLGVSLDARRLTVAVPGARGPRLRTAFAVVEPALRAFAPGVSAPLGTTRGSVGRLVLVLR
jgi:hypothetical protein